MGVPNICSWKHANYLKTSRTQKSQKGPASWDKLIFQMERIEVTFFKYVGKGMAAHSSILACRTPWTEEPGGLQSMGVTKSQTQLKWLSTLWTCRFSAKCWKFFYLEEFWILDTLAEKGLQRWFNRVLPELKPFGGVTSVSPGVIKKKNHPLHSALGLPCWFSG